MFWCHTKPRVLLDYSKQSLSLFSHGKWVTSKEPVCSFHTMYRRSECVSFASLPVTFSSLFLTEFREIPDSTRGSSKLWDLQPAPASPERPLRAAALESSNPRAASLTPPPVPSLHNNLLLLDELLGNHTLIFLILPRFPPHHPGRWDKEEIPCWVTSGWQNEKTNNS